MIPEEQKIERMVAIARMYYEKDMNQSQIAKALGISRPLVSLLLTEAKANGIVTITIHDISTNVEKMAKHLKERFLLKHVLIVPDEKSSGNTNLAVAGEAYRYCFGERMQEKSVGIGWGSMIGYMAEIAEGQEKKMRDQGRIFPLTGGIPSVIRGYHTNEIVRILALQTGKKADFLYVPALFDTNAELELVKQTEPYISIQQKWDTMEYAVTAISNFPSYPDMGVKTIYGERLTKEHAIGRMLAYYFDQNGKIIEPDEDSVLQVSIKQLKKTFITAVCSALVKPEAAIGALRLGWIDTLILPQSLAKQILEQ